MQAAIITIITDSLGMPRDCTSIEHTWVYQLMLANKQKKRGQQEKRIIYFFPMRARHTKDIVIQKQDLLIYQKSDYIIIQVGIVDACRRITKRGIELRAEAMFGVLYRRFRAYFLPKLTKLYAYHYVSPSAFKDNCEEIIQTILQANAGAKIFWIRIAQAGNNLISKVFHIAQDIEQYNAILYELQERYSGKMFVIDPYLHLSPDIITIKDGHHLSEFGHSVVFQAVCKALDIPLS